MMETMQIGSGTWDFFLRSAKKEYVLDLPLGDPPVADALQEVAAAFSTRSVDYYESVECLMLTFMDPELQKHF